MVLSNFPTAQVSSNEDFYKFLLKLQLSTKLYGNTHVFWHWESIYLQTKLNYWQLLTVGMSRLTYILWVPTF